MSFILIVDDEDGMRKSLSILFEKEGYLVCQARNGEDAIRQLEQQRFDLIITDLRMNGISGTELLDHIKNKRIRVPVIIMTAYGTIDSAVSAMRMGAYDYVAKPFEYDEILHRAKRAIESGKTAKEMDTMLQAQTMSRENFVMITGHSPAIKNIKSQLKKVSATDLPVLITGETGTGKNLLAKAIHLNSPRALRPFISVNCASIPDHLLESELFGHTKGAFTGAIMERKGLFEAAHQGTILLDEIGSITKAFQMKLLSVLQEKVIRKVGSNEEIPIDTRVIAATNVDLLSAIRRGEFREDLYYRINILHMHMPPLREYREDIPILAERFLAMCTANQNRGDIIGFVPDAMDKLCNHSYPGNVRELYNTICRSVAIADPPLVLCEDLFDARSVEAGCSSSKMDEPAPVDIKEWERKIIQQSVARHPNNLAEVCRELKIGRTTLWRKMKQYKIDHIIG